MSIILGIEMVIALGLTLVIALGLAIVIVTLKTKPHDGKCPPMESAPHGNLPYNGKPPWELISWSPLLEEIGIYTPLAKIKVAVISFHNFP
jgi:hypothetical protein